MLIMLFHKLNLTITFVLLAYLDALMLNLNIDFWFFLLFLLSVQFLIIFLKRFTHDLNCYKYFLSAIVIATNILEFPFLNKYLFGINKAKYTNKHANSIVKYISDKVPKTLIRSFILIGECDWNS